MAVRAVWGLQTALGHLDGGQPAGPAIPAAYFAWGWAGHDEMNRIRGVAQMNLAAAAELHGLRWQA